VHTASSRKQLKSSHVSPFLPQVLRGNPLVQSAPDQELNFGVKRRWDDDVVFKNQDRGAPKKQQRFINDTIRCVQVLISSAMQLHAHLSVVAARYVVFRHNACCPAGQTSTNGSWIATSSSSTCGNALCTAVMCFGLVCALRLHSAAV
jgi:Cwf15/Cwc15 cell cycle control protein